MKKLICLLIVIFCISLKSYSQTGLVQIENVTHGYKSNGYEGMKVDYSGHLGGCLGSEVEFAIFFFKKSNGEGGPLYGGISNFKSADGQVCNYYKSNVNFSRGRFATQSMFIPYDAIPHQNELNLSMVLVIRKGTKEIARTAFYNFHFKAPGGVNNGMNFTAKNYITPALLNKKANEPSYGTYTPQWEVCHMCAGTGVCAYCNGSGYNCVACSYWDSYLNKGSGVCGICHGARGSMQ